MCSRAGRALLALTLTAGPTATAQHAERWRDSVLALEPRIRALRETLLQGDSTVAEVAREGELVIGASPSLRAAAAAAMAELLRVRDRWFGGELPQGGFRIVLRSDPSSRPDRWWLPREMATVVLAGFPDTSEARRAQRNVAPQRIAENLIDLYGELMYTSTGPALPGWLESIPPLSIPDRERRHLAMYALATGTGRAQRGCVAGRVEDCRVALNLVPPSQREAGGSYAPIVRADFLLEALELGGPAAWTRLRQAAGLSIDSALTAAAGMPADSLILQWRSELLAERPTTAPVNLTGIMLWLGWTAGLLLGAIGVARWA